MMNSAEWKRNQAKKEAGEENDVFVHHWSRGAATVGVFIALALAVPSDIMISGSVGLLCPPVVILSVLLRVIHIQTFSAAFILLLIMVSAAGNAFWYMLLAETARLILADLNRYFFK